MLPSKDLDILFNHVLLQEDLKVKVDQYLIVTISKMSAQFLFFIMILLQLGKHVDSENKTGLRNKNQELRN